MDYTSIASVNGSNSAPTTGRPHHVVAEQGRLQARRLDEYMRDEHHERDRRIVGRCVAEHSAIGYHSPTIPVILCENAQLNHTGLVYAGSTHQRPIDQQDISTTGAWAQDVSFGPWPTQVEDRHFLSNAGDPAAATMQPAPQLQGNCSNGSASSSGAHRPPQSGKNHKGGSFKRHQKLGSASERSSRG